MTHHGHRGNARFSTATRRRAKELGAIPEPCNEA